MEDSSHLKGDSDDGPLVTFADDSHDNEAAAGSSVDNPSQSAAQAPEGAPAADGTPSASAKTSSSSLQQLEHSVWEKLFKVDFNPLSELNDAEKFAFCSLMSVLCSRLPPSCDPKHEFSHQFIASLLEQAGLSKSITFMKAVISGEAELDVSPFLDTLCARSVSFRLLLLQQLLSFTLMGCGALDARAATLSRMLAAELNLSLMDVAAFETKYASALMEYKAEHAEEIEKELKAIEAKRRRNRYLKIGAATAVGGVLIGVTGGLAAPLVAAGAGAIFGTGAAVTLGSVAGIYTIGALFAAGGAGLAGYKMKRRVGKLEEFRFAQLTKDDYMSVTICISGWVRDQDLPQLDFVRPWLSMSPVADTYCLVWETKILAKLGNVLERLIKSEAIGYGVKAVLTQTVLAGLLAAIAWPATLMKVADVIDNCWSVAMNRADAAGQELANALLSRSQGGRPVTLVGYSLGARVIYSCLRELSTRSHNKGIIQNVYLIGPPVNADPAAWKNLRSLVSGRFVVCRSENDWLLKFVFRTTTASVLVAGVEGVDAEGVENVDLSDVITSHFKYQEQLPRIQRMLGLRLGLRGAPSLGSTGQRVSVYGKGHGIIRYTEQQPDGRVLFGICLDHPRGDGRGVFEGKEYFSCRPNHAFFAYSDDRRVRLAESSKLSDNNVKDKALQSASAHLCYSSRCPTLASDAGYYTCYSPTCRRFSQLILKASDDELEINERQLLDPDYEHKMQKSFKPYRDTHDETEQDDKQVEEDERRSSSNSLVDHKVADASSTSTGGSWFQRMRARTASLATGRRDSASTSSSKDSKPHQTAANKPDSEA